MMQPDWHPADIIAALKKQGTSLSAVSRQSGLASSTLANALKRHWPKGEKLIAKALGVAPSKSGRPVTVSRNTARAKPALPIFCQRCWRKIGRRQAKRGRLSFTK
ncbi:transcriptional regulator [Salmonella enterica subsp. arizonae]|nr:transcriptional regulator [Salmonella enterica subsp. arizonae]